MKNKAIKITSFAFTVFVLNSCTTDSLSDLTIVQEIETVNYTQNIKLIIDNNCISCHAATPVNGAPNSLTTYENVKEAVLNRGLIERISIAEGSPGAMPLGGPRLPQNDINTIIQWNAEGLLE
ncbi:cytochrome c [Flavobacterium piscinae]|uniref:Cytochrome c n=1 Tax=Flavobacterium piscinae TaxID=2506424 RepID=A0A4Q1KIK7_9FLAO|nr:cytochrome c [Flavobacterium piscinae]MBC8884336.1 cytochrome c [Flavobacterium piscinae]RXR29130.1 cytochrome c [Flavobacterium piscinae]